MLINTKATFLKYRLPLICWIAFKTTILVLPSSGLPSSSFLDFLPYADKWIHFGLFAISTGLLIRVGRDQIFNIRERKQYFFRIFLIFLLYSVTIEVIQHYVPERGMDFFDVVANLIGVAIAFLLYDPLINTKLFGWLK